MGLLDNWPWQGNNTEARRSEGEGRKTSRELASEGYSKGSRASKVKSDKEVGDARGISSKKQDVYKGK